MTTRRNGLDPQTRALVERLSPSFDSDAATRLDDMRAPVPPGMAELAPRQLLDVADFLVPGEAAVPVRAFIPHTPAPRPVLVWLHPGGFVAGEIDDVDGVCRELAARGRCAVVSVDYRLAPEHPFPAAVNDVTAVVRWISAHAATLGLDATRIAIGGQSSGAAIAASTTLRLRDDGGPQAVFQVLCYPVLDPSVDTPSYVENDRDFLFTRERTAWCWEQYLGGRRASPLAAPLLAERLSGLPPALIVAAGFDPARDDSRRYHERLRGEGGESELVEYEHTIHAFLSFAGELDVAHEALDLIGAALRRRLAPAAARLHHVALPYEPGGQERVRRFYGELLGLREIQVPDAFAGREFVWFAAGAAGAELHLIPASSQDASDRHACLEVAALDDVVRRLEDAGLRVDRYDLLPDRAQAFLRDPFGNLVELTAEVFGVSRVQRFAGSERA
jgi:acetyl esterase